MSLDNDLCLIRIFQHCHFKTLRQLRLVCKRFRDLLELEYTYRKICSNRFSNLHDINDTWKSTFSNLIQPLKILDVLLNNPKNSHILKIYAELLNISNDLSYSEREDLTIKVTHLVIVIHSDNRYNISVPCDHNDLFISFRKLKLSTMGLYVGYNNGLITIDDMNKLKRTHFCINTLSDDKLYYIDVNNFVSYLIK